MNLLNFQIKAVKELISSMEDEAIRDIVLKSPTGSGKTIMMTHFMDEYLKGHSKCLFVWLTPGKGNLEEQSKDKMDKYIHNAQTKLLKDVMVNGFRENDSCFIKQISYFRMIVKILTHYEDCITLQTNPVSGSKCTPKVVYFIESNLL